VQHQRKRSFRNTAVVNEKETDAAGKGLHITRKKAFGNFAIAG
jgi:hypothetical protein